MVQQPCNSFSFQQLAQQPSTEVSAHVGTAHRAASMHVPVTQVVTRLTAAFVAAQVLQEGKQAVLDVRLLDSLDPGDGSTDRLRLGVALDAPSAGTASVTCLLSAVLHLLISMSHLFNIPECADPLLGLHSS